MRARIAQKIAMRFPQRFSLLSLVGLGALVWAYPGRSALAQAIDVQGGDDYSAPQATERDGFMIGLGYGFGYGSVAGYPNKVTEIGVPEYRAEAAGLGSSSALWLGGALRDWVTFGVGFASGGTQSDGKLGAIGSLGIRLEFFPLFALDPAGGLFRNLGISTQMGVGFGSIAPEKHLQDTLAVGGSMAFLGVGAFWEPLKFWHIALGPAVQFSHAWSETLHGNVVTLGLRTAFYATLPKAPKAPKPAAESAYVEPRASQPSALSRW